MKYLTHIVFIFLLSNVSGQDITFKNISTEQGLSSNLVYSACQGPDGLLWIIANYRLDTYNEGKVTNLTNDLIENIEDHKWAEIMIDESNIIWLRSYDKQLFYLDQNRRLKRVDFPETLPSGILNFLKTGDGRVDIIAKEGHFYYDVKGQKIDTIHLFDKPIYKFPALQVSNEGEDIYVISVNNKAILYDGKLGKSKYVFDEVRCNGAAMINENQMLVSTGNHHELFLVDINKDEIIKNLALDLVEKFPQINTYYRRIKHLDSDHIGITSGHQGLFILNVHDFSVENFAHDFANPSSISSDNSYFLYANKLGNVFVTSRTSGLNIFNQQRKNASHIRSFVDYKNNKIFEGHISHLVRDKAGKFWLASSQGLLKYNAQSNSTSFNVHQDKNDKILSSISMFIDEKDRKWVGVSGGGVDILNGVGDVIKSFKHNSKDSNSLKSNFVYSMAIGIDEKLWVGTSRGINKFDLRTLEISIPSKLESESILKTSIREIKRIEEEVFVGTWTKGGYVYTEHGRQKIEIPERFNVVNITAFGKDEKGNLFVGTKNGLFKFSFNSQKYEFEKKLLTERILSIDKDRAGYLWVATENILYKFDTEKNEIGEYTDENGFTGGGFRMHASYMDMDGILYYGMNTGLCFFDPAELSNDEIKLNPWITGIFEDNDKMLISRDEKINLPSQENNIGIYYQNIDIWNKHTIQYQYSVTKGNDEWIPAITNPILIQNIKSGSYSVRLRASLDGEKWVMSSNEINLQIAYEWWRSFWFYGALALILAIALYNGIGLYRRLKAEKLEEVKYDESLKFFSISMHKYSDIDNEFWEVMLECIRQLDIDASSIYLLGKEKSHLLRQAIKVNSKSDEDYLKNPATILIGKGAIGKAALERIPSVFNDLSEDRKGIDNNSLRHSKICVPILSNNEILGVIDCEHQTKEYFNDRRLSFLSAISTIVATKIEAHNAEEERKEAEISLSNNLKKVSELEMKSLRSQMNPHFMFNSLNSINNFIVKNDQENASDYLTNFAQLMRIILENSRQDWVSLESELKALRLYIEMEELRFENLFFYHESISEEINLMTTLVPPMLIQPYIENAIWHGLLPKKSDQCNLKLSIDLDKEYIRITIDDDGIGTKISQRNKSSFNITKKSFGMKIIAERLDMINEIYDLDAKVQMLDKSDISENETGTRVILSMKLKMTD